MAGEKCLSADEVGLFTFKILATTLNNNNGLLGLSHVFHVHHVKTLTHSLA